jgi:hypothetical protein
LSHTQLIAYGIVLWGSKLSHLLEIPRHRNATVVFKRFTRAVSLRVNMRALQGHNFLSPYAWPPGPSFTSAPEHAAAITIQSSRSRPAENADLSGATTTDFVRANIK